MEEGIYSEHPNTGGAHRLAGEFLMNRIGSKRLLSIALGAVLIANAGYAYAAAPKAKLAYVVSCGDDTVVQFKLNPDGTLSPNTPATVTTIGARTVAPVADPTGRFLYVTEFGHNTVLQYKIGADGTLTPNTPASIDSGANPRNLTITPSGAFVYVPSLNDATISQYKVNADGTLAHNS